MGIKQHGSLLLVYMAHFTWWLLIIILIQKTIENLFRSLCLIRQGSKFLYRQSLGMAI